MGFDDQGNMWSLWGDKTIQPNAQDKTNFLGAVVRIHPNRDTPDSGDLCEKDADCPNGELCQADGLCGGGYTIPEDNPFMAEGSDWAPEIYATGLRSPWRGQGDRRR